MIPLGQRPAPIPPAVRDRLRRWVRTCLAVDEEVPVTVAQVSCRETGCAPVETVLAVLLPGEQVHRSVALPAELVSLGHVRDAFTGAVVGSRRSAS